MPPKPADVIYHFIQLFSRSLRSRWTEVGGLLLCILVPQLPAQSPLGRRTNDRHADLVQTLIEENQLAAAAEICQRYRAASPPGSLEKAQWSIWLSTALVATALNADVDQTSLWEPPLQVIEETLAPYPDQDAAPWLQFQALLVDVARCQQMALRVQDRPEDGELLASFLQVQRKAIEGVRRFAAGLEEKIPLLRTRDSAPAEQSAGDLQNLLVAAQRREVELMLLGLDVHPPQSDDAIAAATSAEERAKKLLGSTPLDHPSRSEMIRLCARVACALGNAEEAIRLLASESSGVGIMEPSTLALWTNAQMMVSDQEKVRTTLDEFYGTEPNNAPRSVEMDLVRLRFLLGDLPNAASETERVERNESITQWIEAMGQRGGLYARRRAERELLRYSKNSSAPASTALLVAEAGQRLRSGVPGAAIEAARLLLQAADVAGRSGDNENAFRLCTQAAAAFQQGGLSSEAANALASAAESFPAHPDAPRYHLEAARILATVIQAEPQDTNRSAEASSVLERLQQRLQSHLRLWPQAETALVSRTWLMEILQSQRQWDEAAAVAMRLPTASPLWPEAIARSAELYRWAMISVPEMQARQEIAERAVEQFEAFSNSSQQSHAEEESEATRASSSAGKNADAEADLIASLGFSRDKLSRRWITTADDTSPAPAPSSFAGLLRRVRVDDLPPQSLLTALSEKGDREVIVALTLDRLYADGLERPASRSLAAAGIMMLLEGSDSEGANIPPAQELARRTFLSAVATAWTGKWKEAGLMFEKLATDSAKGGEILIQGARVLSEGGKEGNRDAALGAVRLWNRLAAGLQIGTSAWHQAKLESARGMIAGGDREGARKLIRYVLLTHPPDDPNLLQQMNELSDKGP